MVALSMCQLLLKIERVYVLFLVKIMVVGKVDIEEIHIDVWYNW